MDRPLSSMQRGGGLGRCGADAEVGGDGARPPAFLAGEVLLGR